MTMVKHIGFTCECCYMLLMKSKLVKKESVVCGVWAMKLLILNPFYYTKTKLDDFNLKMA